MNTARIKALLPDIIAVVVFVIISFAYFFPADIEGRILYQHDSSAGRGAGQEAHVYLEKTGERTRWTGSTFSGMPTYQTAPSYSSAEGVSALLKAYHLWLPENVWYLFVYLLGFYIMLRAFNFRQHLAALGSIIWAFSSYFLIIIAAGHIWKVMALAYLPPMIGGVVMTYRGKYLWGTALTALFAAFEVNANHVQMTYYYMFIILFMVVAFLVEAIQKKEMARFAKATACCAVAAAIGIAANISNLYHTWEYTNESMRGKSELVKQNTANQTSSGLERDYITQWSYGLSETWTLLVPNSKGGASVPMSQSEVAMKKANPDYVQIYDQIGQYWGDQPMTSGPVYIGAFVFFLFILSLFIVKGPMKWALLGVTILSVLLSWGRNFMPFTDFFIDNIPMYAKFRTVASILVIAEFTMPLMAILALKELIEKPELISLKSKPLFASAVLSAGLCLLFYVAPSFVNSSFLSSMELQQFQQIPDEYRSDIISNLSSMREAVFAADCLRSFWFIVAGLVPLVLYRMKRVNATVAVLSIAVICLVDMWVVDKRYLNDGMFVEKSVRETDQPMTDTDREILKDTDPDYRVLNLASNTFNENNTSYYHKSIGGYHAAKLRRYQELIDAYISKEMQGAMSAIYDNNGDMNKIKGDSVYPVLNMLNAKYFILPMQGGKTAPLQNIYAQGNAWFADNINYVDNANAELDGLRTISVRHEAVADKKFESVLGKASAPDSLARVRLTSYAPNELSYEVDSKNGGIVVFSEIYYPSWTCQVDGKGVEIGRVNYVLRAIRVDGGKHKVRFEFRPKSIDVTEAIAYAAGILLLIIIAAAIYSSVRKEKEQNKG